MSTQQEPRDLHILARLHGIQSAYLDCDGRRKVASDDALRAGLQLLGAPVEESTDLRQACHDRLEQIWSAVLPPVVVDWHDHPFHVDLRVPRSWDDGVIVELHVACEDGEQMTESVALSQAQVMREVALRDHHYRCVRLRPVFRPPLGYHRLTVAVRGQSFESLMITAPFRAWSPRDESKTWGVFLPLYALHSQRSLGVGDFTDLERLVEWTKSLGGRSVGTLPVLASFLDYPLEYSPYSPASRLYWNELYADPTAAPEFTRCPESRRTMQSAEFRRELEEARQSNLVQYAEAMRLKRSLLEPMARQFFAEPSDGHTDLQPFLTQKPDAVDYASFRAMMEELGPGWREWPERYQYGRLQSEDVPHERRNYHLYAQLLAHSQIQELANKVGNGSLYLDLPLGVNNESYDMWRYRSTFAEGASVGAPPDPFFTGGQDWGFAPLHPVRIREQGYEYFIRSIRHHMSVAGILRVDHAMCFHRLFWIPRGVPASDGFYVRYRPDEFYAIMTLEAMRNQTLIVGEDLGTVPHEVRREMERHDLRRIYAFQLEAGENPDRPIGSIPPGSLACLNTHDLPPFGSWWSEKDLQEQVELGYLQSEQLKDAVTARERVKANVLRYLRSRGRLPESDIEPEIRDVLEALNAEMAESSAAFILVNLEDLWVETERQNAPGTTNEVPNWRRKARWSLEDIVSSQDIVGILERLDRLCRANGGATGAPSASRSSGGSAGS